MTKTTRAQRQALRRANLRHEPSTPYREFRRRAQPTFFCNGAIAIELAFGLWLCIEADGYTHS